ncbi:MAG TPA: hypothetical protein VGX92_17500 [Pyrinomonadaceae bacterium]|jgi:hypothetical protein|nr:hypothetical protein [Pyrinomonadaceae bacterium]
MPATITLILKGLLAIFVNTDRTECTVGILRNPPPEHTLEITVTKQLLGGGEVEIPVHNIGAELYLDVQNTSQPNITFRDMGAVINRQVDPATNRDSFKWVVDLENEELYNTAIGANRGAFHPLFIFNSGELFARSISRSHLFIRRGLFGQLEDFGFVASEVGVAISLDQENSRAVFTSGGVEIFTSEPDTNYVIDIDHDAAAHSNIVLDANHYYKAVGLGLSERERISFMSIVDDSGPAGPEAACFSGHLSKSPIT